ncbi:substrate-binding domain-containing protein [Massilia sp. DWR3-1-1]|uniref:substrate-binding domain-containing protein n=1 Tax=Massilia sp. DWR3-1-1 TaxID=2804559 RepID=UPI003CF26EFD
MRFSSPVLQSVAVLILAMSTAGTSLAENIRIGGTGAALGTMTQLAASYTKAHPEHRVRVFPSLGTSGGLKALRAGAIEIAVSARDVNAEEKGAGLYGFKYGTTAFILISHAALPAQPLTKESIAALYSGRQTMWASGQPVRLILRPKGDADTQQLSKFSVEIEAAVTAAHAKSGMATAITDTDAADQLETTLGALSTSTLALVLSENRHVNILSVDGVLPTIKSLDTGNYPHTKDMYVITPATASPGVKRFLDYLRSPPGAAILKRTGHRVQASG